MSEKKTNAELSKEVGSLSETMEVMKNSTNEALDVMDAKFDTIQDQLSKLTNLISQKAANNATSFQPEYGTDGLAKLDAVSLDKVDGDDNIQAIHEVHSDVDSPMFRQKAETEKFMSEMVTIHIQDTAERNADPRFSIGVNGRQWHFVRNRSYTVPRYVVYGLYKARPVSFRNEEYTDPVDGVRKVRYPRFPGLKYPFAVTHDTPRGLEWGKKVQMEPA